MLIWKALGKISSLSDLCGILFNLKWIYFVQVLAKVFLISHQKAREFAITKWFYTVTVEILFKVQVSLSTFPGLIFV